MVSDESVCKDEDRFIYSCIFFSENNFEVVEKFLNFGELAEYDPLFSFSTLAVIELCVLLWLFKSCQKVELIYAMCLLMSLLERLCH